LNYHSQKKTHEVKKEEKREPFSRGSKKKRMKKRKVTASSKLELTMKENARPLTE
jgi:hypothetical protein